MGRVAAGRASLGTEELAQSSRRGNPEAPPLWWSFACVLFLLADSLTDVTVVIYYWNEKYGFFSLGTFLLFIIPNILIQVFSMRWHFMDEVVTIWHWISHGCLLGAIHRHVVIVKARLNVPESTSENGTQRLRLLRSDVCMLHLFESFLEAAPQLTFQLYIMITWKHWNMVAGISVIASSLSIIWAIINYLYILQQFRSDISFQALALMLQFVWRGSLLIARISALLLFAVGFHQWIFVLLGVHWLVMTIWVIHQKTDFCPTRPEEIFYNCIVGVIYCFCFFNLKESQARYRMFIYYIIMISQNFMCLFLFIFLSEPERLKYELVVTITTLIIGGTLIGISSMIVFYRWFHPLGPISWFNNTKKDLNTIDSVHQIESNEIVTSEPNTGAKNLKKYTLRSFKRPWLENSNKMNTTESVSADNSPQSEVECTDKKSLLDHWTARNGSPTFTAVPIDKIDMMETTGVEFYSVVNTPEKFNKSNTDNLGVANTSFQLENEPSDTKNDLLRDTKAKIYLKNKRSGICSPIQLRVDISNSTSEKPSLKMSNDMCSQKRRAICSSSQLEGDINSDNLKGEIAGKSTSDTSSKNSVELHCSSNEKNSSESMNFDLDLSFSDINSSDINEFNENIVQKLCLSTLKNIKNVHQDADIQNIQRIALEILKDLYNKGGIKDDQDIESELSSSVGRDLETPSEVLSTHDYENICAVNIAREAWGLRSWRACADMGASPPPPPLPARRHLPIPTVDRDQYINTVAYELAKCEESNCEHSEPSLYMKEETDSRVFVAKPYVIDQNGGMFPLTTPLEPILEEIDDFVDMNNSIKTRQRRFSESALVATIDEIRHDTVINSPRNVYHRADWDSPHLNVIKNKEYRGEHLKLSRQNLEEKLRKEQLPDNKNKMNENFPKEVTKQQYSNSTFNVPFSYKDFALTNANNLISNSVFNTNVSKDISLDFKRVLRNNYGQSNDEVLHSLKQNKKSARMENVQNETDSIQHPNKSFSKSLALKKSTVVDGSDSQLAQEHNLSYEEIMFLSQLVNENTSVLSKKYSSTSSTEDISNLHISSSLQLLIDQDLQNNISKTLDSRSTCKKNGTKPRRKFSLLREKFEPKSKHSDEEMLFQSLESVKSLSHNNLEIMSSQNLKNNSNNVLVSQENILNNDKENLTPLEKVKNEPCSISSPNETVVLSLTPCDVSRSNNSVANMKEKRSIFLKQVLSPPKINNWNKK